MRLAIIGTGYVGLVTGAGLADVGNRVTCVDIDADKINRLNRGEIPIYEPGLDRLVARNRDKGRLFFSTDLSLAVREADIIFIAVGTPPHADGSTDLNFVIKAAEDIARALKGSKLQGPKLIGVKSTVPVGTCARVQKAMAAIGSEPVAVFSNPEFLKEGDAVSDFMRPDRIIVGTDSSAVRELLRELYEPFTRKEERILFMSVASAELAKYAANAMLATRISFMNELANLAEVVGANIEEVRIGIGRDPRIGNAFLFPGIGYGGSCFPKDVRSLIATGREKGIPLKVLDAVHSANAAQARVIVDRLVAYFGGEGAVSGKRIAVWGLAFKPNTDDIREAPALVVIEALLGMGASVVGYDPVALDPVRKAFGSRMGYAEGPYEALEGADALVVATEWHDFRSPDVARMQAAMKKLVIFDGRNVYGRTHLVREACAHYWGVGGVH